MKLILTAGVLGVLLLVLLPKIVGSVAALVFQPVAEMESRLFETGTYIPALFGEKADLIAEINALKRELVRDRDDAATIEQLTRENADLRSLLGNATSTRIGAGVIGRPTVTPYDVIILDKGARDGVIEDAPVYVDADQVIGFVSEVFSDSSIVVLATTPELESTVYIFGPDIYTTARGMGGGVLVVSVPQGIQLTPGDLVVIPSFESGVFGTVSVVDSEPTEPEQRGYVTLDVPLRSLRYVSIGTTPLVPQSFEAATDVVEELRTDLTRVPVPSGILVDTGTSTATSTTATSTATTTVEEFDGTVNTE